MNDNERWYAAILTGSLDSEIRYLSVVIKSDTLENAEKKVTDNVLVHFPDMQIASIQHTAYRGLEPVD